MTVYADILIGVNILINFLLLMLTGKICKSGYKTMRIVLAAFLGFDNSYFMKEVPYVRVLGFKDKELVSKANKISKVPIVTKVADIKETKVFQMENIDTYKKQIQ